MQPTSAGGEPATALILNVDDDEVARYAKSRVLRRAGWQIMEAETGEQALDLAAAHAFDLVVLDVRLPGVSGIEVCRRLKEQSAPGAGPLVLQTSATLVDTGDRVRGLEGGADYYLAQPFEPAELVASARALLRLRSAEQAMLDAAHDAERTASRLSAQNDRLELLAQATGELLSASHIDEMLGQLFERIRAPLQLDFYFHFVFEPDGSLSLVSFRGVDASLVTDSVGIESGQAVCAVGAAAGTSRVLEGVLDSDDALTALLRRCGVDAYACTPLLTGDAVAGTLCFGRRRRDPFSDDEVRFLRTLTGYVSVARERLRTEQRLVEQAAELRDADRRKDEFLAILAHELRNPLAPIANAARLLKMLYPHDSDLERWRSSIERQTQHLARMVDDLLDVARVSQGKIALRRERVAVSAFVATALESVGPMIEARRHRLDMWMPDQPVVVLGDPTRLSQIIANLLSNAAKYTPEGGRIELEARLDGQSLIVKVRDNGIGLEPELIPSLFQLFAQADQSLDRSQGGLGLGLALTRQLVELHGGSVEARSEGPGQGSEFIVRLPALPLAAKAAVANRPRVAEAQGERAVRVMIVEDNVDAAESASELLRIDGHEVRTASDGIEALGVAAEFRPQVMLIDIGLPRLDGYELAQRLRRSPETRDALLVALTGYGQPDAMRRSLDAGFDRHFVKPLDPGTMLELVRGSSGPRT